MLFQKSINPVHCSALDLFIQRWIAGFKAAMGPAMAKKPMQEHRIICCNTYTLINRMGASKEVHLPCVLQYSGFVHLSLDCKIDHSDGLSHGPQTNTGQQNRMLHCKSVNN
jgi:hypothetical protein